MTPICVLPVAATVRSHLDVHCPAMTEAALSTGITERFRKSVSAALLCVCVLSLTVGAFAAERIERSDLGTLFDQAGVTGTFVLFDIESDLLTVVNPQRAEQRFFPASTFKIANSLIALENEAVADEDEIIPFGGKPQHIKAWEKDMSMRQAIAVSNVPVYQELARRIGLDLYGNWLAKLDYGNRTAGNNVETFWLVGPLAISALEQVEFLARLSQQELMADRNHQLVVRDIIRVETQDGAALFAKSGWTTAPDPDIVWFVGWVEKDNRILTFAMNLDADTRAKARLREPLARGFLKALDIWPPAD